MSHPRLEKVLADAMDRWPGYGDTPDGESLVALIPPAIADRLEAALDVCHYVSCGWPRSAAEHQGHALSWHSGRFGRDPHIEHHPRLSCHPYRPLVEVIP